MPNAPVNKAKAKQPVKEPVKEQAKPSWEDYLEKIHYSDRYSDDFFEYRHVILPKPLLRMIPKTFFQDPKHPVVLRLLKEEEWRGIGIAQSHGWEHYEVHAPEPHVLLFRRSKDFAQPPKPNV